MLVTDANSGQPKSKSINIEIIKLIYLCTHGLNKNL